MTPKYLDWGYRLGDLALASTLSGEIMENGLFVYYWLCIREPYLYELRVSMRLLIHYPAFLSDNYEAVGHIPG
jgi:hypothetical protein